MGFGTYLRELREARGVTVTELARRIGVTTAYLSDIERRAGKRPPRPERVERIAEVLNLSQEESARLLELATRERLPEEFRDRVSVKVEVQRPATMAREVVEHGVGFLPLLAEVPAGRARDVADEVLEERPVPAYLAREGRYLLRIDGQSMAPVLQNEDIVLVDGAGEAGHRSVVAARIAFEHEDRSTVKQLYVFHDRVVLHPLNPDYDDVILARTGEADEAGNELFEYERRRVRLFVKGVVLAIVWRELKRWE